MKIRVQDFSGKLLGIPDVAGVWNFRPEEVALPLPRLAGPLEADRVVRDLEKVNGLTVVFRQVPRQLVVCGVRQIHIFCNLKNKDNVYLLSA